MAINKTINKRTNSHGAMRNCIEYVLRPDKTSELLTSITRSRAWVRVCGVGEKMQQIQKEYNQCVTNDYDLHFRIPTDEELKKARRLNRERTSTEKRILETTKDNINELIDNIEKGTVDSELLPELNKLMELLKRG